MGSMTASDLTAVAASDPSQSGSAELSERLNWLRAGVLGANDGIVSVAATVVGVAAATSTVQPVMLAGVAAVIAGMLSMALGEYVSVSSAADTQRTVIGTLRRTLGTNPASAVSELRDAYVAKGLSPATAEQVALELTEHDPVSAHLSARYHLDEDEVVSAWHAAVASGIAFLAGAILPMLTILLTPVAWRIPVTVVAVLIALAATGGIGAKLGGASVSRAVLRVVVGGMLALAATWFVGHLLGVGVA